MLATMLAVIMLCVNGCGNADSPDDTTVSEKTAAIGKTEAPSAEITETTGKSSSENIETTGLSQGGNISTGATNTSSGGTIVGHTHQYGPWTTIKEPTCLAMGVQERICTCGTMETRNIDKIEHIIVKDAAKVATCTEPGLTEGSHCSMCGIVIQKQEPILALGHDYVNGRCSRCGEIFEQVSQGLQYTLGSNGTYSYYIVTGIGTCKDTDIVIPAEYKGLPVTSIGDGAFYRCISLTSIEIPSGVTGIGNGAFQGCSSLASIEIPSSVTSIGSSAFEGCSSLTNIEIPSTVKSVGDRAFSHCSILESITVAEKNSVYHSTENCLIETASKTLIAGCKNSVIPADGSVTSIGDYAFSGCSSLTSIEIPSSVTSIGGSAFASCSKLTSIEIPSSVTSIGNYAFWYCGNLTNVNIPSSVTSIGGSAFAYCSKLTSIEIPSSVTSIGDHAFFYCSSLTSIEIPSGVTNIGSNAFYGCSSLTNIEIPSSVTRIEDGAFSGCRSLRSITYKGTKAQWNQIRKWSYWNDATGDYTIHCTNGDIEK